MPLKQVADDNLETIATPNIDQSLNSLNAGFIVHRVGQVNPGFMDEAVQFSQELANYMNAQLHSITNTTVYVEHSPSQNNIHWLVHMHTPADYAKLLNMSDHDKAFQEIYQEDRLPQRGGGNWERMFVQSSFSENILAPQHGFAKAYMEELRDVSFVPPARHQIDESTDQLLHSNNSDVTLVRTLNAKYELRDLARYYLSQWQQAMNQKANGAFMIGQYEEMWGYQDRLHVLINLRSMDDLESFRKIERDDADIQALLSRQWVEHNGVELKWDGIFVPDSITETLLVRNKN